MVAKPHVYLIDCAYFWVVKSKRIFYLILFDWAFYQEGRKHIWLFRRRSRLPAYIHFSPRCEDEAVLGAIMDIF
jgi:hypothetical protein